MHGLFIHAGAKALAHMHDALAAFIEKPQLSMLQAVQAPGYGKIAG
jgi:hypothetical protein